MQKSVQINAGEVRPLQPPLRYIATVFFSTRVLIILFAFAVFFINRFELSAGDYLLHGLTPHTNIFLRFWQKWDSIHYILIAENGYVTVAGVMLNTAFFPLYPFLGFLVSLVLHDATISLLLVSNIAFFFALLFFFKLVALDYDTEATRRAVLYLSISPFSVFFVGIYTESLFFLFLVATWYYARTGEWYKAAAWGVLLTATRLIGLIVIPALAWEYMKQRGWKFAKVDRNVFTLAIMPIGLLGFLTCTYFAYGNFFSTFESSHRIWGRQFTWPWVAFEYHIVRIVRGHYWVIYPYELFFGVMGLLILAASFKYLRSSYALLAAGLILFPLFSGSLGGFCRFLMVVFPMYLLLALAGKEKNIHLWIVVLLLVGVEIFATYFANGIFIG